MPARLPQLLTTLAIGALSGAVLLFEITLTRIFSFTIWHHFAFMVISVALLGFAAAGVALQVRPSLGSPPASRAALHAALFSVTLLWATALIVRLPLDPTHIGAGVGTLARLALYYAALLVPFFFAGLAVVTLLRGFLDRASRLYAADLVGAGLGCLLVVLLLRPLGALGVVVAAAGLGLAASAALAAVGGATRGRSLGVLGAGSALILLAALGLADLSVPPGPAKGLGKALDGDTPPGVLHTLWSPYARIDVLDDGPASAWARNPAGVEPPRSPLLLLDGDAETPLADARDLGASPSFLDWSLPSAAHQAFRPERVLVIGAGGGIDVLTALHHGAREVTAVEIHPDIVDLVRGSLAESSGGLFLRDDVVLHRAEGRSFVRTHEGRYDLVQLSLIDTWAATASGAYSLAEGYLYTVEAFRDFLGQLEAGGVLSITRWGWQPPREVLRLVVTATRALEREGVADPALHVAVLGLGNMGTLLVKPTPLTAADIDRIRSVAAERGLGFLYAPGLTGDNAFTGWFAATDREAFLEAYPYVVRAATDDSPFFFQFGRWRDARPWGSGWKENLLVLSGRLVLLAVLAQAALLSVVLLVLPLRRRHGQGTGTPAGAARVVGYFFLVGLAFMLAEIALMQRLTLALGSPVQALAVVLAGILVFAGLGSAASRRLVPAGRVPWAAFGGLAVLLVLYAALMPPVIGAILTLPWTARLLASLALLAPVGFLMGLPFPAALERVGGDLVGWAWAANGCASVIGPVAAVMLAMDTGFGWVLALAAAGYLGALLVFLPRWQPDTRKARAA